MKIRSRRIFEHRRQWLDETGRVLQDDAYMDLGVSREQDAVETKSGYISQIGFCIDRIRTES